MLFAFNGRRSSKVAVALAAGGLVPPLLEPLMAAVSGQAGRGGAAAAAAAGSAPILRAKLLDIISIMYQHHPRPKEFIMKYRIQVSLDEGTALGTVNVRLGLPRFQHVRTTNNHAVAAPCTAMLERDPRAPSRFLSCIAMLDVCGYVATAWWLRVPACAGGAGRTCCGWALALGAPADAAVSLLPAAAVLLSWRLLATCCLLCAGRAAAPA